MTKDTIMETRRVGLQHTVKLTEIKFDPRPPYPLVKGLSTN